MKIFKILAAVLVSVCLYLPQAAAKKEFTLTGQTMGTYYRIKFMAPASTSQALWEKKVDLRLKQVNQRLSMYQKDSELSRFNALPPHQAFTLSADFYTVLVQCARLHQITQGAWDGTVKPLVDLWGFGTQGATNQLPEQDKIAAAMEKVGFDKLVLGPQTLTKTVAGITLDLGSIAKGYGVEAISRLFVDQGVENCLVEIGGELRGLGKNKKGKPWQVGISIPAKGRLNPGLLGVVALENQAIATSGNYRNYYEIEGKPYSHIIHPATGYPVDNQVVSVSVLAQDCTLADGLATALMVMDTDQAIALVNTLEGTECLIIQEKEGQLIPIPSQNFPQI